MSRKKVIHEEQKSYNFVRKILVTMILLLSISTMIFSGIKIYNWWNENRQTRKIIDKISNKIIVNESQSNNDKNKYTVDFESLKQTNNDIVGWLKVEGTKIEYLVVKTTNNKYYLSHSFDKKYNSVGWIFMDYTNKLDGTDKNVVIYGHNRKDGSMFGTLKNILNKDWYNNPDNKYIHFITENENSIYEVFSVYKIEKEDYYITTNFNNDNEYEKFINKIKSRSIKDFGVEITSNDKILTLSTCADNNKYRVVLHAKKITE